MAVYPAILPCLAATDPSFVPVCPCASRHSFCPQRAAKWTATLHAFCVGVCMCACMQEHSQFHCHHHGLSRRRAAPPIPPFIPSTTAPAPALQEAVERPQPALLYERRPRPRPRAAAVVPLGGPGGRVAACRGHAGRAGLPGDAPRAVQARVLPPPHTHTTALHATPRVSGPRCGFASTPCSRPTLPPVALQECVCREAWVGVRA